MTVAAVLVAAGRGERLGAGPKALVPLAGRTLLEHALAGLRGAGLTDLVVVHPPGHAAAVAAVAGDARLVPGGETRTASVRAGVAAAGDVDLVAVHDAARALTPPAVIAATVAAVTGDVLAAAPGQRVADTLKRVDGDRVLATVDRDDLVAIQTPQVFRRAALARALASGHDASDDLALVERLVAGGELAGRVITVPGAAAGRKITYAEDLDLAAALLAGRP